MSTGPERHLGLFGATAVGVGAIVGGGILALAGVAFATAGPAAILAFGLNGVIALLTAASFAELARRFPESGGTYTYAKKVLSIEVAFVVGWVVWFASIVAGVLYALGFAAFAVEGAGALVEVLGGSRGVLAWPVTRIGIALISVAGYTLLLVRRSGGGGNAATVGKVVVFAVLLLAGVWAWLWGSPGQLLARMTPFAPSGALGLIQAMGYTFIALQGFDLIAAVGGEVKEPSKNLPRAMYLSLGIALAIYLPLLFMIVTVGGTGVPIDEAARANPEGLVAAAARQFMGAPGYWFVIVAGLLSMLSALQANLLGASRVSFAMARDRTLPRRLGKIRGASGTPAMAVLATAGMMTIVILLVGDVSAAGAASSLIFLVSFATVHWAAVLARRRSGESGIPFVPLIGTALCLGLAFFQGFAVREAGGVATVWMAAGVVLYLLLLAPGARLADASAQALDPDLARLRGRSPLVLVPIANPDSAASLVEVAATVRTPGVGRILLLSVVRPQTLDPTDEDDAMSSGQPSLPHEAFQSGEFEVPRPSAESAPSDDDPGIAGHPERRRRSRREEDDEKPAVLRDSERILGESLRRSFESDLLAEVLFTIAPDPWGEIIRVARTRRCETVLVGLPRLNAPGVEQQLDQLISQLETDAVIVRARRRLRLADAKNVLVPLGGRRDQSLLRARLLASLTRSSERKLHFLRVISTKATPDERRRAESEVRSLAADEAAGAYDVHIEEADDPQAVIVEYAAQADLVVLGVKRRARGDRSLSPLPLAVARNTQTPIVLISRR